MLNTLYNFKKSAFHVKAFNWIYGIDPVKTFPTMCPYFWAWVFTVLFSWVIIPIRLLIPGGKNINTKLLNWKKNRDERHYKIFLLRVYQAKTDKDLYNLKRSKCFKKYESTWRWERGSKYYDEPTFKSSLYSKILRGESTHSSILYDESQKRKEINRIERDRRLEKRKQVQENPFVKYIMLLLVFALLSFAVYGIGLGLYTAYFRIDWPLVGEVGLFILSIIAAVVLIYYFGGMLIRKLICLNWADMKGIIAIKSFANFLWRNMGALGRGIVSFFAVIVDTAYSIYKKQCPRITWEDK